MINGETQVLGLIGNPVKHSKSPEIHNKGFNELGLNYVYLAFEIEEKNLKTTINTFKQLNFLGFNVTMPFKETIIEYLDDLDISAKRVGAVNTVKNINGKLIGYNTDGDGYVNSLINENIDLYNKKILILGAGGAVKSIGFSLLEKGIDSLIILNRTIERAISIKEDFNYYYNNDIRVYELNNHNLKKYLSEVDIIINATPLEMDESSNILPENIEIPKGIIFSDLIYSPEITNFLKQGIKSGNKIVKGKYMLQNQAYIAFEIWTGKKYPI